MVEIRCAERLDNRRLAGRYRLEDLIAHGGMADVYRAYDDSLGRRVAVKVYRSGVGDASRARNEMELLTRLQHRHLVRLLDASGDGESDYLILELFEHTLADRIATNPIPADEAAAIGHAVARGLAYLHNAGIVHGDIKPANILLGADGRAVISDLGVARLADSTPLTATDVVVGTPRYLAPEQLHGDDVAGAADVYSLGLVLLEALTGRPTFDGTGRELLDRRLTSRAHVPTLPAPWQSLLGAMTHTDPVRRPAAHAVASTLGDTARGRANWIRPDIVHDATGATPTSGDTQPAVAPAPSAPRGDAITGSPDLRASARRQRRAHRRPRSCAGVVVR